VARRQTVAANLLFGLFMIVLALNLAGLGFALPHLIQDVSPGSSPLDVVCSLLLPYALVDLLLRLHFQRLPSQKVEPYLHLNVPRNTLVHVLLVRSLFTLFNLFPFLVIVPFAVATLAPILGAGRIVAWCAGILLLLITDSYLNLLLQKLLLVRPSISWMVTVAIGALGLLVMAGLIPLDGPSRWFFGSLVTHPEHLILLLLLPAGLYELNLLLFRESLYPEMFRRKRPMRGESGRFYGWLEGKGTVGRLAALEIRLFLRNRRPRASLIYGVITTILMTAFFSYFVEREPSGVSGRPSSALAPQSSQRLPGEQKVEVRVVSESLSENAWVYITGNDTLLGQWRARGVPLRRNADGTWSRTFYFSPTKRIEFKVNLGSRETEALTADGTPLPITAFEVSQDTTVTVQVPRWRAASASGLTQFMILYFGVLMVGILMLLYGQFLFAWEGGSLEGILSRRITLAEYCRAKYLLLVALGFAGGILSLPVVLLDSSMAGTLLSLTFYVAGVNSLLLLFMATFVRKRVDLSGGLFSTQGKGAVQFLGILPVLLPPLVLSFFLHSAGLDVVTIPAVGLLGTVALLLHRPALLGIVRVLAERKYGMISGFRRS
jgi:hypothetical protein